MRRGRTPLEWARQLRDRDERPPRGQLAVLWALALRLDRHGTGYASHRVLARDAGVHERTAKRATRWARDRGLLVQTRRGHRTRDGESVASEWSLQGVAVDNAPKGTPRAPKGTQLAFQGVYSRPPARTRVRARGRGVDEIYAEREARRTAAGTGEHVPVDEIRATLGGTYGTRRRREPRHGPADVSATADAAQGRSLG